MTTNFFLIVSLTCVLATTSYGASVTFFVENSKPLPPPIHVNSCYVGVTRKAAMHLPCPQGSTENCTIITKVPCPKGSTNCATISIVVKVFGFPPERLSAYTCSFPKFCSKEREMEICSILTQKFPYLFHGLETNEATSSQSYFQATSCEISCCSTNNCNVPPISTSTLQNFNFDTPWFDDQN